ncbi:carbohydrate-selective porin OprB [Bradyrhizobium sp. USDA 377]
MSWSTQKSLAAAIALACTTTSTSAFAGAKDESAAAWLAPKWFNEWHDGLANKGLNFDATYIADNIANVSGGVKRGAIHFGRLDLSVDADLDKLVGWTGGRFYASAFVIYGQGLSRNYLMNLATISEIEALPDQRLYNAYFEQSFFNDRLNIRAGQQAADVEFFDSQTDDLFVNGTFGWPAIKASNLPAGGPAPPIAVPGIRIKAALSDKVTLFGAVFNGDPPGPGDQDPQLRDHHGLAFRVNDPPWLIGQVRFNYDIDVGGRPLAGNFTPGAWKHYGSFDSQRFTAEGQSIADPAGTGLPARLRGNYVRPHRLQPSGSQFDRSLPRRRHRLRRLHAGPSARPLRRGDGLHADIEDRAQSGYRYEFLYRRPGAGAQQRDAYRDDLRSAHQAGLADRALLPVCVPPLGRHPEPERSDRSLADR